MMTNLFSSFDPSTTSMMSLNWLSASLILMIIPPLYWYTPQRYSMVMWITTKFLIKEFKMTLGPNSKGVLLMFSSMFLLILFNNTMGLIPYVFTSSSHLMFSLSLALPMWISLMLYGWMNYTKYMFAHLIPENTPTLLIPFMVCIETISNIIRPGSLSVRLMANMVAGHLFMSLLGNCMLDTNMLMNMTLMIIQMLLMMFEGAVAIIQAYVFSTLSSLYTNEVTYENK